jgi:hypothetical protein
MSRAFDRDMNVAVRDAIQSAQASGKLQGDFGKQTKALEIFLP